MINRIYNNEIIDTANDINEALYLKIPGIINIYGGHI